MTNRDGAHRHELQIELGSAHDTQTFAASCEPCGWTGADRENRQVAEEDFERHVRSVKRLH